MPNPSLLERDHCPDCVILERENAELKKQLAEYELMLMHMDKTHRCWGNAVLNWVTLPQESQ